jgi:predicted transcriptional regulator
MTKPTIQSFQSLREEMIAVAKGERAAPAAAGEASVHSAEVLARLLTQQNRKLMSTIRDKKPRSIAELAKLSQRAAPNVVRTLDKLVALGLVYFLSEGRSKAPRVAARKITIEIDPYSSKDVISVTPAGYLARSDSDRRSTKTAKRPVASGKLRVARPKEATSRSKHGGLATR